MDISTRCNSIPVLHIPREQNCGVMREIFPQSHILILETKFPSNLNGDRKTVSEMCPDQPKGESFQQYITKGGGLVEYLIWNTYA